MIDFAKQKKTEMSSVCVFQVGGRLKKTWFESKKLNTKVTINKWAKNAF